MCGAQCAAGYLGERKDVMRLRKPLCSGCVLRISGAGGFGAVLLAGDSGWDFVGRGFLLSEYVPRRKVRGVYDLCLFLEDRCGGVAGQVAVVSGAGRGDGQIVDE